MAVERRGAWRRVIEVPGLGTLNKGGEAVVASVLCASADSCATGGYYTDGRGHYQGFVAVEKITDEVIILAQRVCTGRSLRAGALGEVPPPQASAA